MTTFAGLDLTASPRKPSAYVLLGPGLGVRALEKLHTDADILSAVERDLPALLGIDAPLSLPQGLHCLDPRCPCSDPGPRKGRECERQLASMGIPSYFTTKNSIIRDMVQRAMALERELRNRGHSVIEVYPYATKRLLWGRGIPRKTTAEGLQFLRTRLAGIVPSINRHQASLDHDLCDAVIAAYTAWLHWHHRTRFVGHPAEGRIAIPQSHPAVHV